MYEYIQNLFDVKQEVKPAESEPFLATFIFTKQSCSKRLYALPDGSLVKDPAASIYSGTVSIIPFEGLQDFASAIGNIRPDSVLVHGVPNVPGARTGCLRLSLNKDWNEEIGTVSRTKECFSYPQGTKLLMCDFDPEPESGLPDPKTGEELVSRLGNAIPEMAKMGWVQTYSTSSCLRDKTTGKWIKPPKGMHVYFLARGDVSRFIEILEGRLWLAGEGYCRLASANSDTGVSSALNRTLIDLTVFSPERLDFVSGAIIDKDEPFYQDRPAPKLHSGTVLDLDSIPGLTSEEWQTVSAHMFAAKEKLQPERRRRVLDKLPTDLCESDKQSLIEERLADAEMGYLDPEHILHFQSGEQVRAKDLVSRSDLDGRRLADPMETSYGPGHAKFNYRFGSWEIFTFAHGLRKSYELKPIWSAKEEVMAEEKKTKTVEEIEAELKEAKAKKKAEADAANFSTRVKELNSSFAYVTYEDRVISTKIMGLDRVEESYSVQAIERTNEEMKDWFRHPGRRTYRRVVFETQDKIESDLWNRFDRAKMPRPGVGKAKCPDELWALVMNLTDDNESEAEYLLAWISQRIRFPKSPQVALNLNGVMGSGKTLFADFCRTLCGPYYSAVSLATLQTPWGNHLLNTILVTAEEVASDHAFDADLMAQMMKDLIFAGHPVTANHKGGRLETVMLQLGWLIISDHEIAVPLGSEMDRRYSVFRANKKLDPVLGAAIHSLYASKMWMQDAVDYVYSIDLSKYDFARPLLNAARQDVIDASRPLVPTWCLAVESQECEAHLTTHSGSNLETDTDGVIKEGCVPYASSDALYQSFRDYCDTKGYTRIPHFKAWTNQIPKTWIKSKVGSQSGFDNRVRGYRLPPIVKQERVDAPKVTDPVPDPLPIPANSSYSIENNNRRDRRDGIIDIAKVNPTPHGSARNDVPVCDPCVLPQITGANAGDGLVRATIQDLTSGHVASQAGQDANPRLAPTMASRVASNDDDQYPF